MDLKKLSLFFYEIGTLRFIGRNHRQTLLTNDISDNIASHSYRVSVIAYFLAKLAKANVKKTVTMALFHDIAETRSGDQNRPQTKNHLLLQKHLPSVSRPGLEPGTYRLRVDCSTIELAALYVRLEGIEPSSLVPKTSALSIEL